MGRFIAALLTLALFVGASGCGKGNPSTVKGSVTVDGQALTSGDVTFTPVENGPVAYGQIDSSGNYFLRTGDQEGLKPGEYTVTVVATGPPPNDKDPPPLLTPPKYSSAQTSDLKKTVAPGGNTISLELSSM
jgi:hypothetical protein